MGIVPLKRELAAELKKVTLEHEDAYARYNAVSSIAALFGVSLK